MRAQDYSRFIGRLPYASEMFGVYRPMIGWNSKRKKDQLHHSQLDGLWPLLSLSLIPGYLPELDITWSERGHFRLDRFAPASIGAPVRARRQFDSLVMDELSRTLQDTFGVDAQPSAEEWRRALDRDIVSDILRGPVQRQWTTITTEWYGQLLSEPPSRTEDDEARTRRIETEIATMQASAKEALARESAVAGMLVDLARNESFTVLQQLFFRPVDAVGPGALGQFLGHLEQQLADPFTEFDPSVGLPGVSVSPIGIVHLFRQYFFEFDTFLGAPVGHVWLSPGASVELVESNTRKTTEERTVSTESESRIQTEQIRKEQDEISEVVKRDNRQDSKLGFTTTVTQGWGTGSATATGSLNLDTTQQMAREDVHKRMREQSEKVSTELRTLYKTTFKTVTEVTDVSSKRYVLANDSDNLLNYEMRRKMRQVGVQVQDVGTYLCWETFVDDPGDALGLANLVHIAKPADLVAAPNLQEVPDPPDIRREFEVTVTFSVPDRVRNSFEGYVSLGKKPFPVEPESGYQVKEQPGTRLELLIRSVAGEDSQNFRNPFLAVLGTQKDMEIGVVGTAHGGRTLYWPHTITVNLVGVVNLEATQAKRNEVAAANKKIQEERQAATRQQQRAHEAAFYTAAKERIEQAAAIVPRRFEDLREEERTVVYRALVRDLMAKDRTTPDPDDDTYDTAGDDEAGLQLRHAYASVLNAIFDIDKMLYFVAPEWWKPRRHAGQFLGRNQTVIKALGKGKASVPYRPFSSSDISNWSDDRGREDDYYITAKSEPARLGASLGWVLQLDGDDNRNRFLNAPWVRAILPIRPGKEQAAMNWLTKAEVEGIDGLSATYVQTTEYDEIRAGLQAAGRPVSDPPTVGNALLYLCLQVERKHAEAAAVALFPDRPEIPDEDRVWSVPVDKVYEHGFYPLERSFRAAPWEQPADTQGTRNFQCLAQWTEILPTDQIVPVQVAYDPATGRQV